MPLVQKTLTLAAGATSDNILANTNYEFVDGNVPVSYTHLRAHET